MRAILIDPKHRTVTEIQIEDPDDSREIQSVLRCRRFATAARLSGTLSTGFEAIYASDDPNAARNERFWFQIDADRDPPSSHPVPGLGLAIRIDKMGGCELRISVAELAARVTFTRRKLSAPGGTYPDK
jgi:hypothetical protein